MTQLALIDASCEASGHPTECEEPATGQISQTNSHNVTVTVGGTSKEIATVSDSSLSFSSHAHTYDDESCIDNESHEITGTSSSNITINGSPVYLVESGVATDPTSGGDVDIVSNPISSTVTT